MSSKLSIEDRLSNLYQFRDLWMELANFIGRVMDSGKLDVSYERDYQEYIARISMMYPRVQVDVQRHGFRSTKLVPVGGGAYRNVDNYDPFLNISTAYASIAVIFRRRTKTQEFLEDWSLGNRIILHTIGTLQFAQELGGEQNLPIQEDSPAVLAEVLSAIRRALRPAFKTPPNNEIDVQSQVEVILRAQGVRFEREAQIEHATKKVKPDFVLPTLGTAVEVKLCNSIRREKEIIEEIGADIVAYRSQYPLIVFVVYDVATISDKQSFTESFHRESGVLIEIVS